MRKPNDKKRPNSNSGSMGQFKQSRLRLVHLSAPLLNHPLFIHAAKQRALASYTGPRYAVGHGTTLNVRRNAMKRKRRELMVSMAGSVRAYRREFSTARRAA